MNFSALPQIELHRHLGARLISKTETQFCVWAPRKKTVDVELIEHNRRLRLRKEPDGYHWGVVDNCCAGTRYSYRVKDGSPRPDPASRYQPLGVHGTSEVVDREFCWTDRTHRTAAVDDLVIYELHVGTFTAEGTFLSAIDRLEELVDLGVTAIELMPLAEAAGRWNWGYDGVGLFAPNHNYGNPSDLKRLVNAAHQKGLAVIVDVVYNHLGPEGNYLSEFGPYFSSKHRTPWGDAPNFDHPKYGSQVRRFIIANAIYWFDEFHVDALRVDAIHCTMDDHDPHIIAELSDAVRAWSRSHDRNVLLIAESNVYDPEMLVPRPDGGLGFDALWCDDFLHSMFATVRPGEQLSDRLYQPKSDLAQTLSKGYVYEGTLSKQRRRRSPASRVATHGLVYSIQNHDFIGNHPLAQRFHQLTSRETQKAAAAMLLLSPAIPMLFMGEEFASNRPFLFFVDFGNPTLQKAVVRGRRREYPQHDWSKGMLPTEPAAMEASKLEPKSDGDQEMWAWYQSLLERRKQWRASGLLCDANLSCEQDESLGLFLIRYQRSNEAVTLAARIAPIDTPSSTITLNVAGSMVLDSLPSIMPEDQLGINHAKLFLESRVL